jgi:two-component system, chemotaxis family, protein-glutamate methylesterase/glutaminase
MGSQPSSESPPPDRRAESPPAPPPFKVVALAASAGGLAAISRILSGLPADFPAAVLVLLHRTAQEPNLLADILGRRTALRVEQAGEGAKLRPATVFVAPPDRHLLVNGDGTLSRSRSEKVHHVRPSADRLFESLAASFGGRVIAVVLSGGNGDGSGGVAVVKGMGGVVIAQDAAEVPSMPRAAIDTGAVDFIVPLDGIASRLGMLVAPEGGEA